MKPLIAKIKPASGFSTIIHIGLTILLPLIVYVLVRLDFASVALVVILLSKWRIFAVRLRHWPANLRANAVDIIVGISILVFMMNSLTQMWQLVWTFTYMIWLLIIKPSSTLFGTSLQSMVGQLLGLTALLIAFGETPAAVIVLSAGTIAYFCARHFFTSFDEPFGALLSYIWGFIVAAIYWVLSHWLLFYGQLAQSTLLVSVVGFGLATIYYLEKQDRLSALLRRQILFIMLTIIIVILVFSEWGDKTV